MGAEVFHALKEVLKKRGLSTMKICENLGEEFFRQLFLLVLAADVSVRVEL